MGKTTLSEVARAAGVGLGTASRALNGGMGVSRQTQQKVEQAVRRLGYQANPVASLLARHRGTESAALKVALPRASLLPKRIIDTAAHGTGVSAEQFDLSSFKNPGQILRVLHARGFDGLLLNFNSWPWDEDKTLAVNWRAFTVIKTGRVFPKLRFHVVRHSAFDFMNQALERLLAKGFRRIAVVLYRTGSETDDRARLGCVMATAQAWRHRGVHLRYRHWRAGDMHEADPAVDRWLRQYQPDAILCFHRLMLDSLRHDGWQFPQDAAAAAVLSSTDHEQGDGTCLTSGNDRSDSYSLKVCFRALAELIRRGEKGAALNPIEYVIEPRWIDGDTL